MTKKTIIIIALAAVLLISAVVGIVFGIKKCGGETQETEHIHNFGSWEETNAPTCTENGVETRICQECGEPETRTKDATGHIFGIWDETTAPTCNAAGEETRICTVCDESETKPVPSTGHSFGSWVQTTAPTCTEAGEKTRICAICDEPETKSVPELEHNWVWIVAKSPTETTDGLETKTCSKCSATDGTRTLYATGTAGLAYTPINSTEYSVSIGKVSATDIFIPLMHNGLPVTMIAAHGFRDNFPANNNARTNNISSITISGNITDIGGYAFYGCTNLTSVTFKESSKLKTIHSNAFYACQRLTSVSIPNSVTNIYSQAFYGCIGLTSVIFEKNSKLTDISYQMFYDCTSLLSIVIPNGVINIDTAAFRNCISLSSVTIPNSVENIGHNAFYACLSLKSIVIPDSVMNLGQNVFYGCPAITFLRSVTPPKINDSFSYENPIVVPASSLTVYKLAWSDYSTNIYPDTSVIDNMFIIENDVLLYYFGNETKIVVPDYVTGIGEYTFSYCTNLISITIPNTVTNIGRSAFQECSNLKNVIFEENSKLTDIGWWAFQLCESLTGIIIPKTVTNIGNYAFSGCRSLTNISFEEGSKLTGISDYTFFYCTSLTNIIIPNGATSIGDSAFSYTGLTNILIPSSITNIDRWVFFGCANLTIYTEKTNSSGWNSAWNNSNFPVVWGCKLSEDKTYVVSFTKSGSNPSNVSGNILNNPIREGYTFGGWLSEIDGQTYSAANVNSAPNGKLTAIWN